MAIRVLVTGGAGYLGSILCEHLLKRGYVVHALDSLLYHQTPHFHLCANPNYHFTFGDARDERVITELLKNVDVIIPLAAVVGAPACDRDPWLARSTNLDAVALVNKLRSLSQAIIYPNTNSGYGITSGELLCTEDSPLKPISLYGQTKVEAEQLLLDSGRAVSLRLATVFGASARMRLDLLVNYFVHQAFFEHYLVIFEKDFKRNFVHIRDVADCFIHAIEHFDTMAGRAFNLGLDSANCSKAELAAQIQRHVPNLYIHFAEVGVDPDKRNYIVSNQRLRHAGFEAHRSLDDGIIELLKAYQFFTRSSVKNI